MSHMSHMSQNLNRNEDALMSGVVVMTAVALAVASMIPGGIALILGIHFAGIHGGAGAMIEALYPFVIGISVIRAIVVLMLMGSRTRKSPHNTMAYSIANIDVLVLAVMVGRLAGAQMPTGAAIGVMFVIGCIAAFAMGVYGLILEGCQS